MFRQSYIFLYLLSFTLSISLNYVIACGGFELITYKLQNCAGSQSDIKLKNFNVSLNKDCTVETTGCVEMKKPFNSTKVHYKISKGAMYNKEGHDDICAQMPKANDEVKAILSFFGIMNSCPVKPKKICGGGNQNKLSLKKYENSMALLAGAPLKAYAMITTEVGVSCFEFEGLVRKIGSGA